MKLRWLDIELRIRARALARRPGLGRPFPIAVSRVLVVLAGLLAAALAIDASLGVVEYLRRMASIKVESIGFWPLFLAPAWLGIVLGLAREMLHGPLASAAIGILAPLPVPDHHILRHYLRRAAVAAAVSGLVSAALLLLVLDTAHRLTLLTAMGTVLLMLLQSAAALGMALLVAQRLPVLTRELSLAVTLLLTLVGFFVALVPFLAGFDPGASPWVSLAVPTGWAALTWSHGLVLGDQSAWLCLVVPLALAAAGPLVFRHMLRVYRIREVFYSGPHAYAVLGEPTGEVEEPREEPTAVERDQALRYLQDEDPLGVESQWQGGGVANRLLARLLSDDERRAALLVLPDDPMQARRLGVMAGSLVAGTLLLGAPDAAPFYAVVLLLAVALLLQGTAFLGYDPWPTGSGYVPLHAVFPLDHGAALRLMLKVRALRVALVAPFAVVALAAYARALGLEAEAGALFAVKGLALVVLTEPYLAGMRLLRVTSEGWSFSRLAMSASLALLVVLGLVAGGLLFLPVPWLSLLAPAVLAVAAAGFLALAHRHFDGGAVDLTRSEG